MHNTRCCIMCQLKLTNGVQWHSDKNTVTVIQPRYRMCYKHTIAWYTYIMMNEGFLHLWSFIKKYYANRPWLYFIHLVQLLHLLDAFLNYICRLTCGKPTGTPHVRLVFNFIYVYMGCSCRFASFLIGNTLSSIMMSRISHF